MRFRVWLFAGATVACGGGQLLGRTLAAANPEDGNPSGVTSRLAGTWIANIGRSTLDPSQPVRRAELLISANGDAITLTRTDVDASGHEESTTSEFRADGREHAISSEHANLTRTVRWTAPLTLEKVDKADGQVVGRATYQLSADAKTLTATVSGWNKKGPISEVILFDRE